MTRGAGRRDAALLAQVALASEPYLADLYGGAGAAKRVLRAAALCPRTTMAHASGVVLERAGRRVGALLGYPVSELEPRSARDRLVALTLAPGRRRALREEWAYPLPSYPSDAWLLDAIAVAPPARRNGCGAEMIAHATSRATQAGCDAVVLSVRTGGAAERFYRSLCFVTIAHCAPYVVLAREV